MFDFFRKKTAMEKLIKLKGLDFVTDQVAEIIAKKISNKSIAYQFIRQELDGASQGNLASQAFAENSGLIPEEYRNALGISNSEVDQADGPQQLLLALSFELAGNVELMAEFRCKIDDKIMLKFSLGKYSNKEDRVNQLLENLCDILTMDAGVMPALTANIPIPFGAYVTHFDTLKNNLENARNILAHLIKITGIEDVNVIIARALQAKAIEEIIESNNEHISEKYLEIAKIVMQYMNQDGVFEMSESDTVEMLTDLFEEVELDFKNISDIAICRTNTLVLSFFSLAYTANAMYDINERAKAKYLISKIGTISNEVLKIPKERYSDLEFELIEKSFNFASKIVGVKL